MPDITMCAGGACPLKTTCYRYLAEADEDQTYFVEPPFNAEAGERICKFYWKNESPEDPG